MREAQLPVVRLLWQVVQVADNPWKSDLQTATLGLPLSSQEDLTMLWILTNDTAYKTATQPFPTLLLRAQTIC